VSLRTSACTSAAFPVLMARARPKTKATPVVLLPELLRSSRHEVGSPSDAPTLTVGSPIVQPPWFIQGVLLFFSFAVPLAFVIVALVGHPPGEKLKEASREDYR
jgi:hypothetical protein